MLIMYKLILNVRMFVRDGHTGQAPFRLFPKSRIGDRPRLQGAETTIRTSKIRSGAEVIGSGTSRHHRQPRKPL